MTTEFRWIQMSLFLILLHQFTAEAGYAVQIEKAGDEITLSCEIVKQYRHECDGAEWLFADPSGNPAVRLFACGRSGGEAGAKSNRLNVTEDFSLVIKDVNVEDIGLYTCRRSGHDDSNVELSVVTMMQHQAADTVTVHCTLSTYEQCKYRVKWLHEDKYGDKSTNTDESQPVCSDIVEIRSSSRTSGHDELLTCEVKDLSSKEVKKFNFRPESSEEKPGDGATAATTTLITDTAERNSTINGWWLYVIVASGVIVVLVTILVVIVCKRSKGSRSETDDITGLTVNPAVTESAPETSQEMADPEDGVSYASVSYTTTNSKAQVKMENEDESVTYSTVKVSSSASDDTSAVYATVNKPKK